MYHSVNSISMPQSKITCVNKRKPWLVFRESLARVHVYMETFRVFKIFESPAYTVSRPLPYGGPHIPQRLPYIPHILLSFVLSLRIIRFEWIHVTHVPTRTSYQIPKNVRCACGGNAGIVFPATDFKGNR